MDQAIYDSIPATLTYADGDRVVPYRDHPLFKDAPDIATFLKAGIDNHREVGSRIPIRLDKNDPAAVENWRKTHMPRLYDAGILSKPAESPDAYNDVVVKPDALPDGWGWNDEFASEFKKILHHHNIPKGAVKDLLALHEKTMTGAGKVLQTSMDEGMAALRQEHGAKFDELKALVPRLAAQIFKKPEELAIFEEAGWGNHPGFLGVLMRLAPLAQADSSFFAQGNGDTGGGGATPANIESLRAELARIRTDKEHPLHKGYWANDPETLHKIDAMYQKLYGTGKQEIG